MKQIKIKTLQYDNNNLLFATDWNIEIKDFFSFMLIILVFVCMTGFFEGLVSVFPFIRNVISIFFEKLYPVESPPETYCYSKEGIK